MKIYLASSFSLIYRVEELSDRLEKEGHIITCKWWKRVYQTKDLGLKETTELKKLYEKLTPKEFYNRPETVMSYESDINGIINADVLIFVADKEIKSFSGANVELGIAIGYHKPRLIYGKLNNSAMYCNSHFCDSIDEVLKHLSEWSIKK